MRQLVKTSLYVIEAALGFLLLAASPLGAQTANLYLVDPGSGAYLANIYTSPYDGSINGGATVPVICDDFADETYVSEDWTANVTSLSAITSETTTNTTVKWADSAFNTGLSQAQAYEAASILSVDILQSASGSLTQELYSYALWALFDPTGTLADPGAIAWLNANGDNQYVNTIDGYVNAAIADVTNPAATINGQTLSQYLSNYHVTIYSYNGGGTTCPGVSCPPPPQEFITVTTPEASSVILMAVDLVGFLALVGFLRKRASQSIS
jgi:hypothetical protein